MVRALSSIFPFLEEPATFTAPANSMSSLAKVSPVTTAPVWMVVCGNLDREIHKDRGWWVQDCSAAMENMLLEATDLGIGSIWLGIYPYEERVEAVKKLFSLPERVMPLGIMALGYAAIEKPANDRYLAGRVHWEQFGAAYTGQAGGPAVL